MQLSQHLKNLTTVKVGAAICIAAATIGLAACSNSGKRITIGKSNDNDKATAGASDLDKKLTPILDKERKCLPLKEISMELLDSPGLFSIYSSSILIGSSKGTDFNLNKNFDIQLAGLKKFWPVQYSLAGNQIGKSELADMLAVTAQDECESVTFQPQSGPTVEFTNRDSDSVFRDSMTLVNRDRDEVRQYTLSRLKPGLLKIIILKTDKIQSCGDTDRTVTIRHELHVSWGNNLDTINLASNYADFLSKALNNSPHELDQAIDGNEVSTDSVDSEAEGNGRPKRPTSALLYVSIAYPVFETVKNLIEIGDIRTPRCNKR